MPTDLAQWKALVAKIATCWALDRRRKANARAKVDAGLCDDPDAYEHPTLHWERQDPWTPRGTSHAAEPVPSVRCMPGSDAGAPSGSEKSTSSVRENRALCD